MNVAILGASADRNKYGNKAVRAYKMKGHTVFPINPKEETIDDLKVYKSITEIPEDLDIISIYLHPEITLRLVDGIAAKGAKFIYLNPGASSEELVSRFRKKGVNPILACSILAIGVDPEKI